MHSLRAHRRNQYRLTTREREIRGESSGSQGKRKETAWAAQKETPY